MYIFTSLHLAQTTPQFDAPVKAPQPQSVTAPPQSKPWTAEEQAMLEKALRAYPASTYKGPERWEKVTSMVTGRTKKEVLMRVKELVAKANKQ